MLAQTFTDFELLVIDNASTDDTAEVANSFNDSRVRCLSFEQAGASFARNKGISLARGEFVALLDADEGGEA